MLKFSVAFIWFTTAIAVLHPHYRQVGGLYLQKLSLPIELMYVSCFLELLLSIIVIKFNFTRFLTTLQLAAIVFFTVALAVADVQLLAHPFGMLTKNLPLLAIIAALFFIQQSGFNNKVYWLLRVGMALIWITEGLFPKILFQSSMEVSIVANSGLSPIDAADFLRYLGILQLLSGVAALTLPKGKYLRFVLLSQMAALLLLPTLVAIQMPLLLVHPFGPITKNLPILIGTYVVFKCSR